MKHQVKIVITSLGARTDVNDAVHSYGGVVLHDVINNAFAHKAIEKGADGLIAVAAGAGGHAGTWSPFALVQEIRAWFDGPIALSGAIANGARCWPRARWAPISRTSARRSSRRARGARERGYKASIVASTAHDIVYTNLFTGVHGNYLRASIERAGLDPDNLPESDPSKMSFASEKTKAWRDIWGSGQGSARSRTSPPPPSWSTASRASTTQRCASLPRSCPVRRVLA